VAHGLPFCCQYSDGLLLLPLLSNDCCCCCCCSPFALPTMVCRVPGGDGGSKVPHPVPLQPMTAARFDPASP